MLTLVNRFMNYLKRFNKNQKGQAMVEYALIIAVVAVVLIGSLVVLRGDIKGIFEGIKTAISDAG